MNNRHPDLLLCSRANKKQKRNTAGATQNEALYVDNLSGVTYSTDAQGALEIDVQP